MVDLLELSFVLSNTCAQLDPSKSIGKGHLTGREIGTTAKSAGRVK